MNQRELATVLAALRCWQDAGRHGDGPADLAALHDIAANAGECAPLTDAEIDALCERLNCGKEASSCPPREAHIVRVLQGELAEEGMTVGRLLSVAGRRLDKGAEPESIDVFQVENDERWWVSGVEYHIGEASPEFVADLLAEQADV